MSSTVSSESSTTAPTTSSNPSTTPSIVPTSNTANATQIGSGIFSSDLFLPDDGGDLYEEILQNITKFPTTTTTSPCANGTSCFDNFTITQRIYTDEDIWRENDHYAVSVIPAMVFIGILMVTGTVGNSIVVYIFGFRFKMATQHLLIVCLACSDLLICLIAMPTEIADLIFHYVFTSVFACKLLRFITMFSSILSSFTLVTIAFDRHQRVTKPLNKQMTVRRAKIWAGINVLGSLCFSWPTLVLTGIRTTETRIPGLMGKDCSFSDEMKNTKYPLAFNAFLGAGFIVLIIVIGILYFRIWKTAKRHRNNHNGRHSKLVVSYSQNGAKQQNDFRAKDKLSGIPDYKRCNSIDSIFYYEKNEDDIVSLDNNDFKETKRKSKKRNGNEDSTNGKTKCIENSDFKIKNGSIDISGNSFEIVECVEIENNVMPDQHTNPSTSENNKLTTLELPHIHNDSKTHASAAHTHSLQAAERIKSTDFRPLSSLLVSVTKSLAESESTTDLVSQDGNEKESCEHSKEIVLDQAQSTSLCSNVISNGAMQLNKIPLQSKTPSNESEDSIDMEIQENENNDESSSSASLPCDIREIRVMLSVGNVDKDFSHLKRTQSRPMDIPTIHLENCAATGNTQRNSIGAKCTSENDHVNKNTIELEDKPSLSDASGNTLNGNSLCASKETNLSMEENSLTATKNGAKRFSENASNLSSTITLENMAAHNCRRHGRRRSTLESILSRLRSDSTCSCDTNSPTRRSSKPSIDKTVIVAFTVSFVFVFSFLPYLTLMFIRAFNKNFINEMDDHEVWMYNTLIRFYFFNSAVNPIIYGVLNPKFRDECVASFCRLFSWCCCSNKKDLK